MLRARAAAATEARWAVAVVAAAPVAALVLATAATVIHRFLMASALGRSWGPTHAWLGGPLHLHFLPPLLAPTSSRCKVRLLICARRRGCQPLHGLALLLVCMCCCCCDWRKRGVNQTKQAQARGPHDGGEARAAAGLERQLRDLVVEACQAVPVDVRGLRGQGCPHQLPL